jgi:stage V sporulation protein AD
MESFVWKKMCNSEIKSALIVATGALLSSLTWQQGESVPCIANAIALQL